MMNIGVPLTWNLGWEERRTVVEIDLAIITESQKKFLCKKLQIHKHNNLFIARVYRIQDMERYCTFKRFNSTEKPLFYNSPYGLEATI